MKSLCCLSKFIFIFFVFTTLANCQTKASQHNLLQDSSMLLKRVPAEFELSSAIILVYSDISWLNMKDIILALKNNAAGVIILATENFTELVRYNLMNEGVSLDRVKIVSVPVYVYDDWIRDFGPISVYESNDKVLSFIDMSYHNIELYKGNDQIPQILSEMLKIKNVNLNGEIDERFYFEGGNFLTDGLGTCFTSNTVPKQNEDNGNFSADTKEKVENILKKYFYCQQIVWLHPMYDEPTNHIDVYAKLLDKNTLLLLETPGNTEAEIKTNQMMDKNIKIINALKNGSGESFKIHRVMGFNSGTMAYESYVNSTIINDTILVPQFHFGDVKDQQALESYKKIVGDRFKVVGINGFMAVQGGAMHCKSMQIPSACGDKMTQSLLFEECDDNDLSGQSCESLGKGFGKLSCTKECRFDVSRCSN